MTKWILALMAGTALLPAAANAQVTGSGIATPGAPESNAADMRIAIDEIIVTAQRYEQRLQDVPLSITAITAGELDARGAASISDLQYSVPGLSAYEYGIGRQFVQLRGMSNSIGASTVGLYLDETPLALDQQGEAITIRLLDMERVEVLRGPQATLYGEGSMGGTIRYIPAAPKLDMVGGSFEGEYSSTEDGGSGYKATGVLNLPIVTEKVGLRLVAGYERVGGYIDSAVMGEKNINSTDIYTLRGTLLAEPSERLRLSLLALHQEADQDGQDFGLDRRTGALVPTYSTDHYTLIQGKLDYDLGFADLAGSASYIDRDTTYQNDLSPFYVPLLAAPPPFGFGLPPGFIDEVALSGGVDYRISNAELRLVSQDRSAFGWTFGANYRELKSDTFTASATAPGALPDAILVLDQNTKIQYLALYGEVSYALTSKVKAMTGLRYFRERKKQDTVSTNFGATTLDANKDTFETVNPRFNLNYAFSPNSMAFVNVAKGFRGGGFNLISAGGGLFTVPPSYEPDKIWTYEVGTKHQLFDNRLMLDASVYRSEWSKVQSYAFVPGSPITVVNNSGDVAGWGADLAATVRPMRNLTLTATYGWNNLEFKNTTADKLPGDPVDGAVRESYSASLDFRPPLTDSVTGIFRIDYQHAASSQITLRNFGGQIVERPRRDLVNVRLGAQFDAFEIALFANNLFDEDAPNVVGPFGIFAENLEQQPRVIGINAQMKF